MVMPLDPNARPVEAERAELECVAEALARSPRLSRLLRYMGEKLFSGEVDQLSEYNIATEVLGRSKTVFNAGEDAIARVETHRLRKRLAEFYESEGRNHPIQVTLPAGTYVPVFIHKRAGETSPTSPNLAQTSELESHRPDERVSHWYTQGWKYPALAASLVLLALGLSLYLRVGRARPGRSLAPASAPVLPGLGGSSSPIRLMAGYSGAPRTDGAGRVWSPDQYFSGGGAWQRVPGFIARTSVPFLFEHSRTGDFSYNIPLKPGSYELHLFFSTPSGDALGTFNVAINGEYVLLGFDINEDALGQDIADERVFRDVSPGKDGFLRINFSGALSPPTLNGIEILPSSHAQLPIRLIMQTTPLTDRKGQIWSPDNYFMNGRLSGQTHPLLDSPDPDLFSGERFGHFTYAIPVDVWGTYTLVLHFAEFYFTSAASGTNGRLFKVMCNGQMLLDNFDIFREGGNLHEVTKTFRHLKPSAQGKLNLTFEPIVNNATVSGIEVLDESP
jgi:hypothetical protein